EPAPAEAADTQAGAEGKGGGAAPAPAPEAVEPVDELDGWIRSAIGILQDNGTPVSAEHVDEIRTIIEKESSGDPRAINNWDINAARGTPSKGLMQTIDPTFDSYKLPGHGEIYDPVDNIIAGVRYTFDRYGGFAEHPGLASMAEGGGYQGY
ncbi:transglycosylase SLT domain-containing protein, partial [Saccharomonospora iraqiensis]|uniref:transglycosylase SLT domain-containing protein n=1 Tax=Saccharomonospora iraqiensis TaxID=52698 RepID=UPI00022E4618